MQQITEFLRIFFDAFISFPWMRAISIIEVVLIILTVITFIGWIIVLPYAKGPPGKHSPKFVYRTKPKKRSARSLRENFKQSWIKIAAGSPRAAVLEADELVGEVLGQMGLPGENFTDRINALDSERVSSTPRLRKAHVIKTRIADGENVPEEEAREALSDYEAFLRELGILQNNS